MADFTSSLLMGGGIGGGADVAPAITDAGFGSGGGEFGAAADTGDIFGDAITEAIPFPNVGGMDTKAQERSAAGGGPSYKKLAAAAIAAAGAAAGLRSVQPDWAIDRRTGKVSHAAMAATACGAAMVVWGGLGLFGM